MWAHFAFWISSVQLLCLTLPVKRKNWLQTKKIIGQKILIISVLQSLPQQDASCPLLSPLWSFWGSPPCRCMGHTIPSTRRRLELKVGTKLVADWLQNRGRRGVLFKSVKNLWIGSKTSEKKFRLISMCEGNWGIYTYMVVKIACKMVKDISK